MEEHERKSHGGQGNECSRNWSGGR